MECHGSDSGCCSGVVLETWTAKNLSSKCVYGPGRSLQMMMMMMMMMTDLSTCGKNALNHPAYPDRKFNNGPRQTFKSA